jgi:hypothetical protein
VKQSLGFHLLAHAATAMMAVLLVATWVSAARVRNQSGAPDNLPTLT